MKRISRHPVLPDAKAPEVRLAINGQPIVAAEGDSVAVAVLLNGRTALRRSKTGLPRSVYCGIGHCFECRLTIDGEQSVRSCITEVREGMQVECHE